MKAAVGWGKVGGSAMEMMLDSGLTVSSASCIGCGSKPKAAHLVEGKHLGVSGGVLEFLLDHPAMMYMALSLHPTTRNPVRCHCICTLHNHCSLQLWYVCTLAH